MFDHAPCKLFVQDLSKCCKAEDSELWILKLNAGLNRRRVLRIQSVWIQGKVETVADTSDKVSLNIKDDTGSVQVTYIGNSDLSWISAGQYCSIIGYIKRSYGVTKVDAVKITDLSKNPVFEKMWPYEVKELKLNFLSLIKPSLEPVQFFDW